MKKKNTNKKTKTKKGQFASPLHALCLVSTHSLHSPACADLLSHVAWLDGMGMFASSLIFVPSSPEPSNVTHAREPLRCHQASFPPWQAGTLEDQGGHAEPV